ncbi:putative protein TPRXL [Limulus polyphemus]|uniref:Uncharacterized protein n=1 Tax=Limulus polyphemus TaxID=6850 RepID=A0ABM1THU1_LIMPO|nr:putative protein TPRXL [Limulus polyphemus]
MLEDRDMQPDDLSKPKQYATFKKSLMKRYLDGCEDARSYNNLLLKKSSGHRSKTNTLLQNILQQPPQHLPFSMIALSHHPAFSCNTTTGSLPPSPADSGVSDVDSSSGHLSNDESKPKLRCTPASSRTPDSSSSNGQPYFQSYPQVALSPRHSHHLYSQRPYPSIVQFSSENHYKTSQSQYFVESPIQQKPHSTQNIIQHKRSSSHSVTQSDSFPPLPRPTPSAHSSHPHVSSTSYLGPSPNLHEHPQFSSSNVSLTRPSSSSSTSPSSSGLHSPVGKPPATPPTSVITAAHSSSNFGDDPSFYVEDLSFQPKVKRKVENLRILKVGQHT